MRVLRTKIGIRTKIGMNKYPRRLWMKIACRNERKESQERRKDNRPYKCTLHSHSTGRGSEIICLASVMEQRFILYHFTFCLPCQHVRLTTIQPPKPNISD